MAGVVAGVVLVVTDEVARSEVDVVVIGAGQAGLSTAYFLSRFGVESRRGFVVLDASQRPGGAWAERSPSLTMAKVHGVFDLPGAHRQSRHGDETRPAAEVVGRYYAEYERQFQLPVHRPVLVRSVTSGPDDRLIVTTEEPAAKGQATPISTPHGEAVLGEGAPGPVVLGLAVPGMAASGGNGVGGSGTRSWAARAVVNATGTWTRPYWPYYPGAATFAGRQLHSADYRGPDEFAGRRVVVVGGGNSAAHVLSEVADLAASTTWVTRRPPDFREGDFSPEVGRTVIAEVESRVRAGLPPRSVVSVTGLGYTTVVREALAKGVLNWLSMFSRIVPDGVEWPDGAFVAADVIVWATGFRAALAHLAPLGLREPGGGIRMDGTRAVVEPRLHLVGYGPSASTIGANRAGRSAAREIADLLTRRPVMAMS